MKGRKFSSAALLLIAAINFYFLVTVRICDHGGTNWQTIIYSDGKGYYEYLRSAFINHDLGKEDSSLGFLRAGKEGTVIKFFSGTAIAYSPFFFIAKVISVFSDAPTDGYTFIFQIMIAIAGCCYCLLGLFFIDRLLRSMHIPDEVRAITMVLITYGTNLFYYAVLEPSMSHVYSFGCIAGFIFCTHRYFELRRLKHLLLGSVFLGLIILIRPINVIVLLMLPFLTGNKKQLILFLKNYRHIMLALVVVISLLFVQLLLWHVQTGSWIIWSYTGEGFYFSHPAIAGFLFSYDKGWFVYTPLALISILGFIPLWKQNRSAAVAITLTFLAAIYISSSWWCWDYANAFGMRPMIDYYSLVAVLIAILITSLKSKLLKWFLSGIFISILMLSIIQTYQYYQNILQHYSMDKDKYWFVFLKIGEPYRYMLGGNIDLMPFTKKPPGLMQETDNHFENELNGWSAGNITSDPLDASNKCFRFDSASRVLVYTLPANTGIQNAGMLYVQVSLKRMELERHSSAAAQVITTLWDRNAPVFNYAFRLNDFPDENVLQWRTFHYAFRIRKPSGKFDRLTIEIVNPDRKAFLVDDMEIKFFRMFQ